MTVTSVGQRLMMMLLVFLLTACSSSQGPGIERGGAVPTVSFGEISAFSSVFVNGVRYETGNATITVNGQNATETDLAVGHVVQVEGTVDVSQASGIATRITFDSNVVGAIATIDTDSLMVLGQRVLVGANTSFGRSIVPASLDGLSVGTLIEVSGLVRPNGDIAATRLELAMPGAEPKVLGEVSNLDQATSSFTINGLTIDFSAANLVGLPNGQPENGITVEVRGVVDAASVLVASRVELKALEINEGDRVEIEGFVSRFASPSDFDVLGIPVTTDSQTQFEGGSAADLALGVRLEVQGVLDERGVLIAEEVLFRAESLLLIAAPVEQLVVVTGENFETGVITLLGIEAAVENTLTRFEDKSIAGLEPFGLSDINVGDYLEVRGFAGPVPMNAVLVTLVERQDPQADVRLRGIAESVSQPGFTILGVAIATDAATQFEDADGNVITADDFFNNAQGRLVSVTGPFDGSAINAVTVRLQN